MASKAYVYEPLPKITEQGRVPRYTRILHLQPGSGNGIVTCSLELLNLDNIVTIYEALSYVWGREEASCILACGNGQLLLRPNLDAALRSLRFKHGSRALFVDAICIDQSNLDERSRQVGYMHLVYKFASKVVVWLGAEQDWAKVAFDFLDEIFDLGGDLDNLLRRPEATIRATGVTEDQEHEEQRQKDIMLSDYIRSKPADISAVQRLFGLEYFRRIWCVQEVVASTTCEGRCGSQSYDFNKILSLLPTFLRLPEFQLPDRMKPRSTLGFWQVVPYMEAARRRLGKDVVPEGSLGSMLTLLDSIGEFGASDDRDRIFALVGVSTEGLHPVGDVSGLKPNTASSISRQHPALIPDYQKSLKQVYQEFVLWAIREPPRLLDILGHVQHQQVPSRMRGKVASSDDLPSWIPRFHKASEYNQFARNAFEAGITPPLSTYTTEAVDNPYHTKGPFSAAIMEPGILQLFGFHVDTIQKCSEKLLRDFSSQRVGNSLLDVPLFPRTKQNYAFVECRLDVAFFQTLCQGGFFALVITIFENPKQMPSKICDMRRDARALGNANILDWLCQLEKLCQRESIEFESEAYSELVPLPDARFSKGDAARYYADMQWTCCNKRVYRTSRGILGVGPPCLEEGDSVVTLFGGRLPFILRPDGIGNWILVGETYLHHDDILSGIEASRVITTEKNRVKMYRLI